MTTHKSRFNLPPLPRLIETDNNFNEVCQYCFKTVNNLWSRMMPLKKGICAQCKKEGKGS